MTRRTALIGGLHLMTTLTRAVVVMGVAIGEVSG